MTVTNTLDREEKLQLLDERIRSIESSWLKLEEQEEQQHRGDDIQIGTVTASRGTDNSSISLISAEFDGADENKNQNSTDTLSDEQPLSIWRFFRRFDKVSPSNPSNDGDISIVRETENMIHQKFPDLMRNPSVIEDEFSEKDYYRALPEDTFSLMILGEPFSKQWIFGMIAFGLQTCLLCVITVEFYMDSKESTPLNVPYKVAFVVLIGQVLALLLCVLTQADLILAISTFMLLGYRKKENWTSLLKVPKDSGIRLWLSRIAFPVSCEFLEGFLVLATTFCIIVQSDSILELFKNFAAMQLVSHIDNVAFWLALNGYLGLELVTKAKYARRIRVHEDFIKLSCGIPVRSVVILILMLAMCAGWSFFLLGQLSGRFFFMKYPYCDIPLSSIKLMNDGFCDGGILNTIDCGFEDGDCIGFNISFPKCRATEPWRIGDGICDDVYNSENCRHDGGDCS